MHHAHRTTLLVCCFLAAPLTAAAPQSGGAGLPDGVQPAPDPESRRRAAELRAAARTRLDTAILADDVERPVVAAAAAAFAADALREDPADLEARYLYAAALGLRAHHARLSEKVRLGNQVFAQANLILERDPRHAGGNFLMGKLNAAVMRMDAFSRFVLRRVLGSDMVRQASWANAEKHFRTVLETKGDDPAAHLELARVLRDTDRGDDALAHYQLAVSARPDDDVIAVYYRDKARAELAAVEQKGH